MSNQTIVAVYGTLLSGQPNNYLLEQYVGDTRCLGKGKSMFFGTMYSNGGYPILSLLEPEHKVEVEVYVVGDTTLRDLDRLEGYPGWYNRTIRTFKMDTGEEVKAYIYHQDISLERPIVPNGDWKAYVESK